jgi:double-stranded uracil-DNA glycosylase
MSSYQSDILATGLKTVFCGINPATSAEIAGHNFSTPSNRFWTVLHLSGFAAVRRQPRDERRLLDYNCGITAVVRRPTRRANEVSPQEFRQARPEFEERMRRFAPRSIAFLGKRAYAAMMDIRDVPWGYQRRAIGGIATWILPNPSGLNRGFTLDALVGAYSEFRTSLDN